MDFDATTIGTIVTVLGSVAAALKFTVTKIEKAIKTECANEQKDRKAATDLIVQNQSDMRDDINDIKTGFERRVDRLEQSNKDFRSGSAIDTSIDHAKKNVLQVVEGLRNIVTQHTTNIEVLREKVTVLETENKQTNRMVERIENELKDTRHEINGRLDTMVDAQKHQFDQLCESIREIRKPPEAK